MRIMDWSSDVCASDLVAHRAVEKMCCDCGVDAVGRVSRVAWRAQQPTRIATAGRQPDFRKLHAAKGSCFSRRDALRARAVLQGRRECRPAACGRRCGTGSPTAMRSEEHTSELQSLMRISYAV